MQCRVTRNTSTLTSTTLLSPRLPSLSVRSRQCRRTWTLSRQLELPREYLAPLAERARGHRHVLYGLFNKCNSVDVGDAGHFSAAETLLAVPLLRPTGGTTDAYHRIASHAWLAD